MTRKKPETRQANARLRAEVILDVRSGRMTVAEAARRMGVSRQTYYKWEQRALEGLADALEERPPGRPPDEQDLEKESLRQRLAQLQEEIRILKARMDIRQEKEEEMKPTSPKSPGPPAGKK